ncbi:Atrial natriuretic peptide receptor 1 [Hypsibius exemplaris]|uniref:guanylate cyclase n=1 Tax=Hypsibius exemplaris TaxID=2072580 RepID=A0A1W0WAK9_HYPEX|nr:Atrial natriuretic peptide receptor 1 [Hypsibius exemplaris]
MVETFIPEKDNSDDSMGSGKTFLTICVTLEEDSYNVPSYNRVASAVDLAIANANAFVLPKSIRLRTVFQSAGPSCSQIQHRVTTNFLHLILSGVQCDAFVGIGCASSTVAMYAFSEELNVPMFACPGAGVASLALNSTRNRFPLMLRISYGYSDLGRSLSSFFDRYNYSHISLFRDDFYAFHSLTSKYLFNYFRLNNPKVFVNAVETAFIGKTLARDATRVLLDGARNRSRVIVLHTHALIVRQFMVVAKEIGLTYGDYVFIALELHELNYWGRINYIQEDRDDENARQAFQSLIVMSLADTASNSLDENLAVSIKKLAKENYNYTYRALEKPDPNVMGFYESIMIYAQEVTLMIGSGLNYRNGSMMVERILGTEYIGITGSLSIGKTNERDRNLDMKTFDAKLGEYNVAIKYVRHPTSNIQTVLQIRDTLWFTNDGAMPPDKPLCGFRNDECPNDGRLPVGMQVAVIIVPLIALTVMATAAVFAGIKLRNLRKDYDPNWWKILMDDLSIKQNRAASGNVSKKSLTSQSTAGASARSGYSAYNCDILASYKAGLVALTDVSALIKTPNPDMISKLNLLKNASHPNLQRFIGIGISPQGYCQYVVAEICAKGSLVDILTFSTMKLDWSFKNSLIKDIIFGMAHIHTSPIGSHGNLNGYTCLIDSRFTLKISDYGLPFFRDPAYLVPYRDHDNPDRSVDIAYGEHRSYYGNSCRRKEHK